MASDGVPVSIPANLGQGSQAVQSSSAATLNGRSLPPGGKPRVESAESVRLEAQRATVQVANAQAASAQEKTASDPAKTPTATNKAELSALVAQLNKYLNDSGRSYQFRVDPQSRNQTIQEINPSSGAVIGEFSVDQFPALARSLGISGVLVDTHV